jgi:hypothetical protein
MIPYNGQCTQFAGATPRELVPGATPGTQSQRKRLNLKDPCTDLGRRSGVRCSTGARTPTCSPRLTRTTHPPAAPARTLASEVAGTSRMLTVVLHHFPCNPAFEIPDRKTKQAGPGIVDSGNLSGRSGPRPGQNGQWREAWTCKRRRCNYTCAFHYCLPWRCNLIWGERNTTCGECLDNAKGNADQPSRMAVTVHRADALQMLSSRLHVHIAAGRDRPLQLLLGVHLECLAKPTKRNCRRSNCNGTEKPHREPPGINLISGDI